MLNVKTETGLVDPLFAIYKEILIVMHKTECNWSLISLQKMCLDLLKI